MVTTIAMVMAVFGCLLMTGCPHRGTVPVDTVTTAPPATPPPTGNPIVPPVADQTGTLRIEGDLLMGEKSISNNDLVRIGDTWAGKADEVCAYLYPLGMGKSTEKGGGAVAAFCGQVAGGRFLLDSEDENVFIPVGTYQLFVDVYYNGYILFCGKPEGDGLVTISNGQNKANVMLDFLNDYWISFAVSGLPVSNLASNGGVNFVSAEYPQTTQWFLSEDGTTVLFSLNVPVQFTGGTVVLSDSSGNQLLDASGKPCPFDISIDMANYGENMPINVQYQLSTNVATLEVDSRFAFLTHILVNGEIVDNVYDLPNALFNAGQNVEVLIPGGDFYLGNVWLPPNVATIKIIGRDVLMSRVHGRFVWDRFGGGVGKGGPTTDPTPVNMLTIDSITIIDDAVITPDDYTNATVFAQGVDGVTLTNCAIVTNSRAVSMNYVSVGTIEHCDFVGADVPVASVNALEASNCGPSPVSLKNSIIVHFPLAVSYNQPGTYAGFYNCMWDVTSYTDQGDVVPLSFIVANPMWENIAEYNLMLKPESPCIGAGDDGADMGVTFKGK